MLLLALLFIAVSSFILMTRAPTVTLTRYSMMITCLDQVNHEIKGYEYDCPDNNYTNNTVPVNINSH